MAAAHVFAPEVSKKACTTSSGNMTGSSDDYLHSAAPVSSPQAAGVVASARFTSAPKTSVQFMSEWRQLKTTDSRSDYLKLMKNPSTDYASIFRHSMESAVFSDLLKVSIL
jgi:hypothetical protein